MNRKHPLPSIEYLRSRISYDPESGVLRWRPRDEKNRHIKAWNTMCAGKECGTRFKNISSKTYYRCVKIDGVSYLSHRIAVAIHTGKWPDDQTDHLDRNGENNRWNNLRDATDAQNKQNKSLYRTSKTGIPGVYICSTAGKHTPYRAQIQIDKRRVSLGYFPDTHSALEAVISAKKQYHTFHPDLVR